MRTGNNSEIIHHGNWILRIHEPGDRLSNRILILLHGWSGDENSMWVFSKDLPEDYWVLSIRAPFSAMEKGYSWRDINNNFIYGKPQIEEFKPAIILLDEFICEWVEMNTISDQDINLVGFSQGGAMVCSYLLLSKRKIRRAASLAGFLPDGYQDYISPGSLSNTKVFVAHGNSDETIPSSKSEEMVQALTRTGAQVDFCTEEVGHKVGARCFSALHEFLTDGNNNFG